MEKSSDRNVSLDEQRQSWNAWNASERETKLPSSARRQATLIEQWVGALGRTNLEIIDVGCGVGWMCERLVRFGRVVGTDLADDAIRRARVRLPSALFFSGDFLQIDLPYGQFDVVITMGVLAHVASQSAFLARIARLLKDSGYLMLSTQNRPVLESSSEVPGAQAGQLRHWVNARQLRALLTPEFDDIRITSVAPGGDQGWLRIVNSHKLNRLLSFFVPERWIEALKERALLGQYLVVRARKKHGAG